uniref:Uncharacterized protein n=1 Tax=Opuntia streptacantha TaxID=393608 RepID=A0A7C9AR30_OPUST
MIEKLSGIYKNTAHPSRSRKANQDACVKSPILATWLCSLPAHQAFLGGISEAAQSWDAFTGACSHEYDFRPLPDRGWHSTIPYRLRMERGLNGSSGVRERKPMSGN